eukprot:scaffold66075_cov62-Phaeocystis_antarctica.AAC.6
MTDSPSRAAPARASSWPRRRSCTRRCPTVTRRGSTTSMWREIDNPKARCHALCAVRCRAVACGDVLLALDSWSKVAGVFKKIVTPRVRFVFNTPLGSHGKFAVRRARSV